MERAILKMDWEIKLDDRGYYLRHCKRPAVKPIDFSGGKDLPVQCRKCDDIPPQELLDLLRFLQSLDRLRNNNRIYSPSDFFYSPFL